MIRLCSLALIAAFALCCGSALAADKPIGKPNAPADKPNCDDLATYLNTPSCWKRRRE